MTWTRWRTHFENNVARPLPEISPSPREIAPHIVAPLLACLQKLQIGERVEGRIAHQIDHFDITEIDDDYRCALKLMIREEGRHAAILGRIIIALGGTPLRSHYTATWFRQIRNVFGVRWKLWILNLAEVVSSASYAELAHVLPDGAVRRALLEIADDEASHLAFHGELFTRRARHAGVRALPIRSAYWLCGSAACAVLMASQGAALATIGVAPRRLVSSMIAQLDAGSRYLAQGSA